MLWSRSRSKEKFQVPVNVHLDDTSSTAEPFVTELAMVMHHHGPESHERLVCYLQDHSEGPESYMTVFTTST